MRDLSILVVAGRRQYEEYLGCVSALFETVFNRAFPRQAWELWYFRNPSGTPLVALAFAGGRLVGHHALVPQVAFTRAGQMLPCRLSVSTMVHPLARGMPCFLSMVDALHDSAAKDGAPFILAFPNHNSAPLFRKAYGYTPVLETNLCNWEPRLRAGNAAPECGTGGGDGMCRRSGPPPGEYWTWRTEISAVNYYSLGPRLHIAYKAIRPGTLMLLDVWNEPGGQGAELIAWLAGSLGLEQVRLTQYHASLLGIPQEELRSHENYTVRCFSYPLAGRIPDIRFSLLLSDVF